MKYKITLPKQINKILEMIEKSGEEAYLIGGCVRDAFLGISPQDFDITTSATPEQIKEIFRGEKIIETGKRTKICGDCQWNRICQEQPSRWSK